MAKGFRIGALNTDKELAYTYSGDHEFIDDGDGNWRIKFYSSGTLNFTNLGNAKNGIDVFCVGGGGGGGTRSNKNYASGGGGGYTKTGDAVPKRKTEYKIVVGAGGEIDADGGKSSAFGVTANGGECGVDGGAGGAGGSGGGAGGVTYDSCYGGSDGSDGATSSKASGGAGQGKTTREFGEETGTLYAGGGGGGYPYGGNNAGGEGGGGNGSTDGGHATAGEVNTGGGGGGGKYGANPAAGGSGIVVIRNKRG